MKKVKIDDIGANNFNQIIQTRGFVKSISAKKISMKIAVYRCIMCGIIIKKEMEWGDPFGKIQSPKSCIPTSSGGCGGSGKEIELSRHECEYEDFRTIVISDNQGYSLKLIQTGESQSLEIGQEIIVETEIKCNFKKNNWIGELYGICKKISVDVNEHVIGTRNSPKRHNPHHIAMIIQTLQKENGEYASMEGIIQKARKMKISEAEVDDCIRRLKEGGSIFSPRFNEYAWI